MLMILKKDKWFPADTFKATKAIVLKQKDEFTNIHGTLNCKLANSNTAAYVPVLQQVIIILCNHRDLEHTCGRNLSKIS